MSLKKHSFTLTPLLDSYYCLLPSLFKPVSNSLLRCLQFSASFNRCILSVLFCKCCSLYQSVYLSFSLTCTYLLLFESPAWIVMIVNLIILPVKVCLEFLSSSEYLKSTLPTKPSGNSNADKILSFTLKWNEKKYNRGFRIKCFG